jgi:CheY-like chemotaxis protein
MLIKRSVPFDLGGDSDVDYRPEGVVARFKLPARFVSERAPRVAAHASETPGALSGAEHDLNGKAALIVEDQMLIAIDLEQMLEGAGMTVLATATSPREAFAVLSKSTPDVAVLDVNLCDGTSEAIARHLQQKRVPFIFATGYGDGGVIPDDLGAAPIVRKPYDKEAILAQLRKLLAQSASS